MHRLVLAMAAAAGVMSPAQGQTPGDAAAGRALAEQYCARCHDITPGGAMKQDTPSFAAIAVYRSAQQITTRIWLPPVHTNMPPFSQMLLQQDVADLTAYILSLDQT